MSFRLYCAINTENSCVLGMHLALLILDANAEQDGDGKNYFKGMYK